MLKLFISTLLVSSVHCAPDTPRPRFLNYRSIGQHVFSALKENILRSESDIFGNRTDSADNILDPRQGRCLDSLGCYLLHGTTAHVSVVEIEVHFQTKLPKIADEYSFVLFAEMRRL